MRLLIILLVSVFALASCDRFSQQPLTQTRDTKTFTMTVEVVPENQITEVCEKQGLDFKANGCAVYVPETNHCTIYVMPQRFVRDQERLTLIGHETWHCRFGQWHE